MRQCLSTNGRSVRGLTALVAVAALVTTFASVQAKSSRARFSAADFDRHVRYLADDSRQGRGIGTKGIDEAAEYVATQWADAGVEPFGDDGSFFQSFEVSISSRIADNTMLSYGATEGTPRRRLERDDDFVPFPFSARGGFDGPVAFVGYGIDEDEAHDYNDYEGIDVRGKVVLMLRYEPDFWDDSGVDEQEAQPSARSHTRHAYFTTKAEHAAQRGAAAVLIVNPVRDDDTTDALYDFSTGRASPVELPMMHIKRRVADAMLAAAGLPDVESLQKKIEKTRKPCSKDLTGIRANGYADIDKVRTKVKNVVGIVRGKGSLANEYVVLGAHYDHLGVTTNWRKPADRNKYVHNGADDNASGTTGLILAARALADGPPLKRSVILIAFTAEESGLHGSKHWVKNPPVPLDRVIAMLNMDMIGRLKDNVLHVGGTGTGEGFEALVKRLGEEYDLKLKLAGGGRGPSDHSSFFGEKIPVLFFFTGIHKQYHAPEDDADLINAEGGVRIASMAVDVLHDWANADKRPAFHNDATRYRPARQDETEVATSDKKDGPSAGAGFDHGDAGEGEAPAMPRVRLGIAPGNYGDAEDEPGFPIEYVVADGPAAKAGIKDKDRILSIDGKEIRDVYRYMQILSEHKPGDEIEVVVLRDGQRRTFKVKLEAATRGPRRE